MTKQKIRQRTEGNCLGLLNNFTARASFLLRMCATQLSVSVVSMQSSFPVWLTVTGEHSRE